MNNIIFIAAVANNNVMGCNGDMPWSYPEDMKRFRDVTLNHPIIMGRKTWDSLRIKPLPGRKNIVISRNPGFEYPGVEVYPDIKTPIYKYRDEDIYIIGGSQIFNDYMIFADYLDITHINKDYDGDVFFPDIDPNIWESVHQEENGDLMFTIYRRIGDGY